MSGKLIEEIYEIIRSECEAINAPIAYNPTEIARIILERDNYLEKKGENEKYIKSFVGKYSGRILYNFGFKNLLKKGVGKVTIIPEIEYKGSNFIVKNCGGFIRKSDVTKGIRKYKKESKRIEVKETKDGNFKINRAQLKENIDNSIKITITINFAKTLSTIIKDADIRIMDYLKLVNSCDNKKPTKNTKVLPYEYFFRKQDYGKNEVLKRIIKKEIDENLLKIEYQDIKQASELYINRDGYVTDKKGLNTVYTINKDTKIIHLVKNTGRIMVIDVSTSLKELFFRKNEKVKRRITEMVKDEYIQFVTEHEQYILTTYSDNEYLICNLKPHSPHSSHLYQTKGKTINGYGYEQSEQVKEIKELTKEELKKLSKQKES